MFVSKGVHCMKENLEARSRLALAFYERAAAVLARRAGASFAPAPDEYGDLIAAAQRLALPGQREAESRLPALTSLAGHLYANRAQGYYRPRPLAADRATVMPQQERPADLPQSYRALWDQFASERGTLLAHTARAPTVQEVGYHALLQRLAWSMPAPEAGDSDVSLFDFARTAAALAVCLADGEQGGQPGGQPEGDAVALLIGGDLSGVQDWLYTIGSSGAARSLRGRSVYLQLLSEVIALYVLDELGLPVCNLLYVGGGNFYVLAPLSAAGDLPRLRREISRRLLAMHQGALYLALGHTEIPRAELLGQEVGAAWGRVNGAMGAAKRQRFSELDDVQMAKAIGEPLAGTGFLRDSCAICRRPIVEGEHAKAVDAEAGADDARACELCESFSDLGSDLPGSAFLVVTKLGEQPPEGQRINNWQEGLRAFGYAVHFLNDAGSSKRGWQAQAGSEYTRIYYWREADLTQFPGNPDPQSTLWLYRPLAQAAPVSYEEGGKLSIATFDHLQTEGIGRWGVLRMDVDNLGRIFQSGLGGGSLSRVVGLSAQLRLLFESHVPLLLEQYNADHPRSTYLMYAGGDDLFVVAGWSHLPALAAVIRDALVEFAVQNPDVTISGGISLALDANYPVYQAARAAGRAEDMAKDGGRNRLAFLGQAVLWESGDRCNYQQVRARVEQLQEWLGGKEGGGKLNRGFLMRLRAINAEWREWRRREASDPRYRHTDHINRRLHLGPWQWHLVYSLSREAERARDGVTKEAIKELIDAIVGGEIEVLGLEARWAELLTRTPSSTVVTSAMKKAKEAA